MHRHGCSGRWRSQCCQRSKPVMMGVQPFQNRPKRPLLRSPQTLAFRLCLIAAWLAILDQDGKGAVTQRQSVARVHYVGRAVSGTVRSADNGVTAGTHISSRDGAKQVPEDFGAIDPAWPRQDRRVAWHVNEHIVVQHNVSLEQMPAPRGIIVEVKDDVRLPPPYKPVDGHRLV